MDIETRLALLVDLKENLSTYVRECIELNDNVITDLVTENQLYDKGIDGDGDSLGSYAPLTIQIKREKGQPTDRVTLRDERDFHNSFRVETDSIQFTIKADDWKAPVLISYWGEKLLALTDENLEYFAREYIIPYLTDKIR